jgi:phosphocarrier protein HPr
MLDAGRRVLEIRRAAFKVDWQKMSTPHVTRTIVVRNKQGLHARPLASLVKLAQQFQSRIEVIREGRRVPATSMIDLLTLGAAQGTELMLEADGDDAQAAVNALAELVEIGFLAEDEEKETRS